MIKMNSKTLSLKEAFDEYISNCKALNYSEHTIKFYQNNFHKFGKFYDLNRDVCDISKKDVCDYAIWLREQNLSDTTIHTYIRGLKAILRFFMAEGYVKEFHIKVPQKGKTLKGSYTQEEIEKILKKPNIKTCSFAQYRNWVLANYLLGTGQRLNTIMNIKIKDVNLNSKIIELRTTKNKEQTVLPLSQKVCSILREYLKFRGGNDNDYLFCTQFGKQMARDSIISAIVSHNKAAGVDRTSVHLFRHTFAKMYLMQGGDVFRLQRLMCHKDISTTKEYLDLQVSDLKKDFEMFNPLDVLSCSKIKMR